MVEQYTGRTRFRTGWRGVLVLQVECTTEHCVNGPGVEVETHRYWRDAKVHDLDIDVTSDEEE